MGPGDSFEKMSAKMIKFEQSQTTCTHPSASPVVSTPVTVSIRRKQEHDEEGDECPETHDEIIVTPVAMATLSKPLSTPVRRHVAVEAYITEMMCEVCLQHSTVLAR